MHSFESSMFSLSDQIDMHRLLCLNYVPDMLKRAVTCRYNTSANTRICCYCKLRITISYSNGTNMSDVQKKYLNIIFLAILEASGMLR